MYPGTYARTTPDKAAYIMSATGEVVTYRQLDDNSMRAAQLWRSRGLEPEDGIALFLENHPRYLELTWAAQRSALRYTAINWHLTAEEVEYIVRDCGAQGASWRAQLSSARIVAAELAERLSDLRAPHAALGSERRRRRGHRWLQEPRGALLDEHA